MSGAPKAKKLKPVVKQQAPSEAASASTGQGPVPPSVPRSFTPFDRAGIEKQKADLQLEFADAVSVLHIPTIQEDLANWKHCEDPLLVGQLERIVGRYWKMGEDTLRRGFFKQ